MGNGLFFTAAHAVRGTGQALTPFTAVHGFTILGKPLSEPTPADLLWDCAVDLQAAADDEGVEDDWGHDFAAVRPTASEAEHGVHSALLPYGAEPATPGEVLFSVHVRSSAFAMNA